MKSITRKASVLVALIALLLVGAVSTTSAHRPPTPSPCCEEYTPTPAVDTPTPTLTLTPTATYTPTPEPVLTATPTVHHPPTPDPLP